jgi:hypothetical protein
LEKDGHDNCLEEGAGIGLAGVKVSEQNSDGLKDVAVLQALIQIQYYYNT